MAGDEWVDLTPPATPATDALGQASNGSADRIGLIAAAVGAVIQAGVSFALEAMKASTELRLLVLVGALFLAILLFNEMNYRGKLSKKAQFGFMSLSFVVFLIFGAYPYSKNTPRMTVQKPSYSVMAKIYLDENSSSKFEKGEKPATNVPLTTYDETGAKRSYMTDSAGEAAMIVTQPGLLAVSVCGVSHTVEVRKLDEQIERFVDQIGLEPVSMAACKAFEQR